jgi:hypothetical protein
MSGFNPQTTLIDSMPQILDDIAHRSARGSFRFENNSATLDQEKLPISNEMIIVRLRSLEDRMRKELLIQAKSQENLVNIYRDIKELRHLLP